MTQQTIDPPNVVVDDDRASDGGEDVALSRWGRFRASFRQFVHSYPLGVASGVILLIMVFCAVFADVLATHDPTKIGRGRDVRLNAPSGEHFFGTDEQGRDIFSRVLLGARISLIVAALTVLVSTVFGTFLGIVSGFFEGKADLIIQRFVDAVLAIPVLILALFIVSLLGSSLINVVLALSIIYTPRFSRIARGEMLRVKNADFVAAADALGSSSWRIMLKHGLPNIVAPIIILSSLTFGQAIVAEAALSFLGVGVPITQPSWGQMLSRSRDYMTIAWWAVMFPGAALSVVVLAFNLLGDALRDHLDPKLVR